ncbi:MAG: 5-formyltetrahydrofolate cyclo-ligase [Verrucomicrobiaceae bacterium]|nr:5-formyltetrahydrofolate cyclo-ligase [Verrucomicrobiaceae bacterium]
MGTKPAIRQRMRQLLREVTAEQNTALITALKHHAASWPSYQTVAIYGGLRGEPDLIGSFLPWLQEKGHLVSLFAIDGQNLAPRHICHEADLVRSSLGAWEPRETCPPLEIADLDIIIVPGLAFSPQHLTRLGRGGGYYDRLLAHPQCKARRIALAHAFQLMDELPVEAHDERVHQIITSH